MKKTHIEWHKVDECLPEDALKSTNVTLRGGLGKRDVTPLVLTIQENNLRVGCGRRVKVGDKWYWSDLTIASYRKVTHWATFNRPETELGQEIEDVVIHPEKRNVI